jgi:hypothetical protein
MVQIHNVPKKFKNSFNSTRWEVASPLALITYSGKIKGLESHKNKKLYTVDWNTISPIKKESTITFLGERINRTEFNLMYSHHTCYECGCGLKFEDGNVALDDDIFCCPSCDTPKELTA